MGYYDFPHTRNYDQDLGFLIKKYKDMIAELEKIGDVQEKILKEIKRIISDMLSNGEILLELKYIEETKTLNMVFGPVGPKKENLLKECVDNE